MHFNSRFYTTYVIKDIKENISVFKRIKILSLNIPFNVNLYLHGKDGLHLNFYLASIAFLEIVNIKYKSIHIICDIRTFQNFFKNLKVKN